MMMREVSKPNVNVRHKNILVDCLYLFITSRNVTSLNILVDDAKLIKYLRHCNLDIIEQRKCVA